MNQIPSLNQFLEEIDPSKTVDREKATVELSVVILLEAVKDTRKELGADDRKKLAKILQNEKILIFEQIYGLFKQAGKQEVFIEAINNNINNVRIDYIKTHLEALSSKKREKVLSKFPALRKITS